MSDEPSPECADQDAERNASGRKLLPSLRFSIRALLVLIALAAVCTVFYLRYAGRRDAVDLLYNHGIKYKHVETSEVPFYLRLAATFLDERALFPIHEVGNFAELHHPGVLDAVAELTEVKHLKLEFQEEAIDLEKLRVLVNVERITADGGFVLDDSFLSSFKKLEVFEWYEGEFRSDFSVFGSLKHLKEFSFEGAGLVVTDESFARFCDCRSLERIDLSASTIGITDFSPILNLPNLKRVQRLLDPDDPSHKEIIAGLPAGCVVE